MIRIKNMITVLLAGISLVISGCSAVDTNMTVDTTSSLINKVEMHADYPAYRSFDELKTAADIVFVGKIEAIRQELVDIGSKNKSVIEPYAVYTVKIEKLISGEYSEPTIDIKLYGGELNGTLYVETGVPQLGIGSDYLLSVKCFENSYASPLNNGEAILGVKDGKVEVFGETFSVDDV